MNINSLLRKNKSTVITWCIILLLAIICYFPIFLDLTSYPVRIWDESRLTINAYEMVHGGNWIITSYDGSPDMWNTKPSLMIWCQAICIYILGFNELAVRLPAAMAALLTCATIFIFCFRYLRRIELGFISVLVLVTTPGYIKEHVTRTGDYDSLLILLTTIYLLCYFIFIESADNERGRKFLLYFFIAFTLAFLCKGIEGLVLLPSLFIYTIMRGRFISVLKEKNLYFGFAFFLIFGIGYYFLREAMNHGYINAVWDNELGGRFNTVIEGHHGPFSYYWDHLINEDYSAWYLLIPCGLFIGVAQTDTRIRNLTWFLILSVIEYFLIISSAQTKLQWYEAPLFPLLAIIAGIFLSWMYNILRKHEIFNSGLKAPVAAFILLFLLFIKPYSQIVDSVYDFKEPWWAQWMDEIPNYMKNVVDNHDKNIDGYKIVYNYSPTNIMFYQKMLEAKNQHTSFSDIESLKPGDKVIISQDNLIALLNAKFNLQFIDGLGKTMTYKVLSKK